VPSKSLDNSDLKGAKLVKRIFLIIIMIGQVAGCSFSDEDKIEKLFEKAGKPESFELLYQDEIDHGLFVLYIDDSGLNHAIYSDKMKYWNVSGNSDLDPKDGFNWGMTNDPHIPIATFAGVITNDEIKKVVVRLETLVNEAVVITTTQGRFWYTYFDDSIESIKGLKIEALSGDGDIIWKDGVYDGEHRYRGNTVK